MSDDSSRTPRDGRSGPGREGPRPLAILGWWALALAAGGIFLLGRFAWSERVAAFSLRGYASSLFLLVPTLITLYGATRLLRPAQPWKAVIVAATVGLLFTLPYRWMGLDELHYYQAKPVGYLPQRVFTALPGLRIARNEWGQRAWERAPQMPPSDSRPALAGWPGPTVREGLVPAVATAVAILGLLLLWSRRSRPWKWTAAAWLAVLLVLALQTWAHVSTRSPYTYVTHHYLPVESNYWHLAYLLNPSEGAVNGDVVVFQDLEQHFWGTPRVTSSMLLRRPIVPWVAAQLTYFFNVFHVYIGLNLALWLAAVRCLYAFIRDEFDRETAWYVALLAACGPGFLMYVAQPTSYLAGYAIIAVIVWAGGRILRGGAPIPGERWATLAGVLGLGLLVYDVLPWLVFILLYGLRKHAPLGPLLAVLAAAFALQAGFTGVQLWGLGLELDTTNAKPLEEATANIVKLVTGLHLGEALRLTGRFAVDYGRGLAASFFMLPLALALGGLAVLRSKKGGGVVLLLLLPSVIGTAFLTYGQATWGTERLAAMPRFTFAAFPGIYLLAALGLREVRRLLAQRGRARLGASVVAAAIVAALILANLDALAGVPQPYYWFYWATGGHF